jgi:shikimate kinase
VNIYLVGYMGSGKSTVGKQLALLLGFNFVDLDRRFEETYRISVIDFFRKYDENAFRVIERKLLIDTFSLDNYVVSTGGGTACYDNNMQLIKQNGLSVYIRMHPNSLFIRLKNAKRPRPRIAGLNADDLKDEVLFDLIRRKCFYERADYTIKGENVNVIELANLIKINPGFSLQEE